MTDPDTTSADYTLRPSELASTLALLVEARHPCVVWGPPHQLVVFDTRSPKLDNFARQFGRSETMNLDVRNAQYPPSILTIVLHIRHAVLDCAAIVKAPPVIVHQQAAAFLFRIELL